MKDMSAEELVRLSKIGFCCYTPAECEEIEAELLSRLKAGERAVKAMDVIDYTCPCLEDCHDCMEIIAQYKSGTQEARKC